MKVKEEEIERLKKARTLPETESRVQIIQLCLKDPNKRIQGCIFLWLPLSFQDKKCFFYYKYILKGFKFEFLKCNSEKVNAFLQDILCLKIQ